MEEEKISITLDGDKWCVLWGENLISGIAGFGDTVDEAMINFAYEILKWAEKDIPVTKILKLEKFVDAIRRTIGFDHEKIQDVKYDLEKDLKELDK